MNKFIGYYRSSGTFPVDGGRDINYDNVCFVCVKELVKPESSGLTFLKDPVRIPYKKFKEITGYYFDEFMQLYPCADEAYAYEANYSMNEYGTLKISSFAVVD